MDSDLDIVESRPLVGVYIGEFDLRPSTEMRALLGALDLTVGGLGV